MNHTSIEQSKKLLELGLSSESADMILVENNAYIGNLEEVQKKFGAMFTFNKVCMPCWSVSALLEIMPLIENYSPIIRRAYDKIRCYIGGYINKEGNYFYGTNSYDTAIEAAYNMVIWLIENKYLKDRLVRPRN